MPREHDHAFAAGESVLQEIDILNVHEIGYGIIRQIGKPEEFDQHDAVIAKRSLRYCGKLGDRLLWKGILQIFKSHCTSGRNHVKCRAAEIPAESLCRFQRQDEDEPFEK